MGKGKKSREERGDRRGETIANILPESGKRAERESSGIPDTPSVRWGFGGREPHPL